jgi:hypothetical protein
LRTPISEEIFGDKREEQGDWGGYVLRSFLMCAVDLIL